MGNENKNAPGSQGTGGQEGGRNPGQDPFGDRKNISRHSGNQPHERPDYEEDPPDRPGYDIDIETEIPGRKDASDRPGTGESGMGSGNDRPDVDDPSRSGASRYFPRPDEERQTKKRP